MVTQLSYDIVGCAIEVHKELGPGLLESVYEKYLAYELRSKGHKVIEELIIPVIYKEIEFDVDFRSDLLVDNLVVVELKAIEHVLPVHEA